MSRHCGACGLPRTSEGKPTRVKGVWQEAGASIKPECLLGERDRHAESEACRRFMRRMANWTPEQHFEFVSAIGERQQRAWLSVAALAIALLSLVVSVAANFGAIRALFQ